DWVYVNDFSSWMWRPRVDAGWTPYSYGRWYWTPLGWDWIDYEPWGWYPSHYGSWYLDASFGWVWGWDSVWAPSWVDWIYTPGYVGWCPRGYYDWWFVHNCTHCWGEGWRRPGRWGEFTFNLSGRVRFGEVDPRPWTVVPTEQFRNPHLERVRLDPARMRDQLGPRDALVRSGPMLTPPPSRGQFTNGVDSFFRGGGPGREVPDLSAVLRREPGSNLPIGSLKPGRTNDFVAPTRSRAVDVRGGTRTLLDGRDVVNGSQRWRGQVSTPITPGTSTEPSRRLYRRDGGTVNPGGHNPPPVVRGAQPAPPPRVAAPDGRGGSQSPPAAKPAPAPQRPSSSSLSYSRPRSVDRSRWQGGAWGDRRVAPTYRAPYAPRAWSRPLGGSSGYAGPSAGGAARSYSAPSRGGSTSRGGGSTWHPTSGHSGGTRPRR
ncbi:MAG TPA: DUF6600 domain-containing protein, partial [Thermoanaerobaculaceae bacterium]|nr:DUF6600 domain-containing protein [Thermoanaerobaculaceae bacterium]